MDKRCSATSDYYRFCYVGTPDYCAPAGLLAYTASRTDDAGNTRQSIVLREPATGAERTITAGGMRESNPRFRADGKRILFLSDATGDVQLYTADVDSGVAVRETSLRNGVSEPVWSPLGDAIAFLSPLGADDDPEVLQQPATPEEKRRAAEERAWQPVAITDYGYKSENAMGFCVRESSHLWVVRPGEGRARLLTDGDRDHVMPVWYPDGKHILITSNRCRKREESIGMDLFSVSVESGVRKQLTQGIWVAYYPARFRPVFSPDGSWIVIGALTPGEGMGMPSTRLYKLPTEGGEAVCLWPENAPCHEATCFFYNSENIGGVYETAAFGQNSEHLYFISGWHGSADIYRASVTGAPSIARMTAGQHHYKSLQRTGDGGLLALKGDFLHTPQVFRIEEVDFSHHQLTDSNPWLEEIPLSKPEELWIDCHDGLSRVQGWVIPPQNRIPGQKYPAVLYIHGGPTPFYGCGLTYEHQCLAGAGIGMIFCNPRGSTGYGEAHADMGKAFDGTAMYDLLQFVEEALYTHDWIDGDRLGVTGGSYGGYMTNWLAGHTRRFKAAVTQRSIANQLIQYSSSDMAGSAKGYASFLDFMVDQVKKSPVAYAEKIDIPFLILHGERDMRCPVEHAHQLFTAVKDTHPELPVRMVLYPGCNHDLPMGGPMRLRVNHYDETIGWFRRYL